MPVLPAAGRPIVGAYFAVPRCTTPFIMSITTYATSGEITCGPGGGLRRSSTTVAAGVGDEIEEPRRHAAAAVRDAGVAGRDLERREVGRAEADRDVARDRRRDAEAAHDLDDAIEADLHRELHA